MTVSFIHSLIHFFRSLVHSFIAVPFAGFFYNIVRVPLPKEMAERDEADLSGAEVLCSIPASDSRRPSYYHSFGVSPSASALGLSHYCLVFFLFRISIGNSDEILKQGLVDDFIVTTKILFITESAQMSAHEL